MGLIKKIVFGDPSFTESQEKKRKLFMYLVSGGLTTVANWIVYIIFDIAVKSDMMVSLFGFEFSFKIAAKQIVGWIVAVIVAYFLNRITVFRSKGKIFRELITFAGARVLSFLVLELGVMYLMVWACEAITGVPASTPMTHIGSFAFTYDYLVKLINCIFVIIANYVLSKLMVFKKKDMVDYNAEEKTPNRLLPGRIRLMHDGKVPEVLTGALQFGIKPGLERITALMNLLGNPQDSFRSIHIAGTNGKGSVATFISSIMASGGSKVGVFTSPYLERFSERIRIIDGKAGLDKYTQDDSYGEISSEDLEKYSEQVKKAREKMVAGGLCDEPTEFELITAICFLYFAEKKIDVAVLEVGLGGRLDSTNIIKDPLVTVITALGLDHTGVLGNTISEITGEKAGIFKEGSPAVCFDPDLMILPDKMKPDVRATLISKAEEKGIELSFAGSKKAFESARFTEDGRMEFTYKGTVYSTALNGRHQIGNAITAIEAARKCGDFGRCHKGRNSACQVEVQS